MSRQLPWFWILLALLVLAAPTPLGRLLLDLLGGLTLAVLLLPLLLAGAGAVAFQILRRRVRTCTVCGLTSLATSQCPGCGAPLSENNGAESSPFVQDDPLIERQPSDLASFLRRSGVGRQSEPVSNANLDVSDVTIDVESHDVDTN